MEDSELPVEPTRPDDPIDRRRRRLLANRAFGAIKAQHAAERTIIESIADELNDLAASTPFLVIHVIWFVVWIPWNLGWFGLAPFDPYPFGLLTMCVSLEAIFLSVIVLLSQNRQSVKDRIRADVDYEVNLKAELEISHLHEKVDHLHAVLLTRLHQIEGRFRG
jgi:uncharacterized membrane protein